MLNKIIIILFLLMMFTLNASIIEGNIKLIDSHNNNDIEVNMFSMLSGENRVTYTDVYGDYRLSEIIDGEYLVVFRKDGYISSAFYIIMLDGYFQIPNKILNPLIRR